MDKKEVEEMLAMLHLLTEEEKKNVLRYIKHLKKMRKQKKIHKESFGIHT